MTKLNYIVTSASNTFAGGACDTDMYFPFAGGKKKASTIITPIVQRKGGTIRNPIVLRGKGGTIRTPIVQRQVLDDTWGYITEDEFEAMDDLEYLGFDGDYFVYADGKGRKFFKDTRVGRALAGAGKGIASAASWIGKGVAGLVSKWGKAIRERKENRKNKKSEKQANKEKKAKEKAEKQGLPPAEVQKVVAAEGQKVKQQEEAAIANAEAAAYNAAKNAGKSIEEVEKAANDAGEQMEKQIYGGYLAGENEGFWKSMGVGGKVAIIGGGALFIGLIVYLVVKKK